jgi:uncharacterized membrane protein YhfC
MNKAIGLAAIAVVVVSVSVSAQLLDARGEVELGQTNAQSRPFKFGGGKLKIRVSADTHPGTVTFDVRAPNGALSGRQSAGVFTMGKWELEAAQTGTYTLEVTPHETAGHWQARIDGLPPIRILYQQILSGGLMMLVAVGGIGWWRRRTGMQWRWFWAGAGIWTVGVALKFAVAIPLNPILIGSAGHPPRMGLFVGSVYSGLMTGVFEIGVTLAAALVWRQLAASPNRAVAVGLGAGGFEALLLGLASSAGPLVAMAVGQGDLVLQALGGASSLTPLFWLVGPAERVIAIAAHTAARVLVLQAVAKRGWLDFWAGFAWLSMLDLLAGAALLTGMNRSGNLWWIELMILPFGVLSIPIIRIALNRWPAPAAEASVALEDPQGALEADAARSCPGSAGVSPAFSAPPKRLGR